MVYGLEILLILKPGRMRDAWISLLQSYLFFHVLVTAENATEGIKNFNKSLPALIIVDDDFPDHSGLGYLQQVKEKWPEIPCIFLTDELEQQNKALARGACAIINSRLPANKIFEIIERNLPPQNNDAGNEL